MRVLAQHSIDNDLHDGVLWWDGMILVQVMVIVLMLDIDAKFRKDFMIVRNGRGY